MRRSATAMVALALAAALAGGASGEPSSEAKPLGDWIEALEHTDAQMRVEALGAIGKLGPEAEAAVPAMIERLGDADPSVRGAAARALGALGPAARSAVPSLVKALADKDYVVTVKDEKQLYQPVWLVVSSALGDIGPAALADLIAALEHENTQVRVGAAGALHRIGPKARDAVDPLVKMLKEDEPRTCRAAIYGLMGIGREAKGAVPALTEALTHEDFHTQYWACRALREIGPEASEAVPALLRLLTEGVPSVRRHAAQALGGIGPAIGDKAVDALARALKDPLEPVREDAVIALGQLGPFAKSAAPAIEETLAAGPLAARFPAARALWLVTGETELAVDVLIDQLDDVIWRYDAADTLGEIGPSAKKAVPALVELLESDQADEDLRNTAAQALKRIDPKAVSSGQ